MTAQPKSHPMLFSAPMVRAILDGRKTQTRRIVKEAPSYMHYGKDIMDWSLSGIHQEGELEGTDRWYLDVQTDVDDHSRRIIRSPAGKVGDLIWGREAWRSGSSLDALSPFRIGEKAISAGYHRPWAPIKYESDGVTDNADVLRDFGGSWGKSRPSIHMPRWASRITLEVTAVRIERLQDISEADAVAEGFQGEKFPGPWWQGYTDINGRLSQAQAIGEQPPEWMIEPKSMGDMSHCDVTARSVFISHWCNTKSHKSWAANPLVWVYTFRAKGVA